MNFIHRAVVKGNLSHNASKIYEANVVLYGLSRCSQEEKFPYTENPFLLSCDRNIFLCFFTVVLCLFYCMELHDFRNRDSVVEIGRMYLLSILSK